jgi:hypothetical protein
LGKHYFESYLVGGMLTKLHRPGFRVITTNDRELSDATLILNEKDVFMIEVKSHALHANVIDQMDVVGLQEFVNEKFASDKKGAGQLARLIRSFGDNTNDSLEIRQPKNKLTIYPIIIYTEQHLEKYGFGDYVAEKFHLLLTEYIHPFRDIKPLVMIHYDFFVENISLLEQRPSLLKSAINRYLSYISQKKADFIKTGHNMDYLLSMSSFDQYIINIRFEGLYQLDQQAIFHNAGRLFKLKDE